MLYDFIYLAKGFRMRPKVRSTLSIEVLSHSEELFSLTNFREGFFHKFFVFGDKKDSIIAVSIGKQFAGYFMAIVENMLW